MKTILQYDTTFPVEIPAGFKIVHCDICNAYKKTLVWAEVDTEQLPVRVRFDIFDSEKDMAGWTHIRSYFAGSYIWHFCFKEEK